MGSTTLLTASVLDHYLSYPENHGEALLEAPKRTYDLLWVMINTQWWQFMVGLPTRSVADGIQQKPNGQSMRKG